jgi:hypothetical protein
MILTVAVPVISSLKRIVRQPDAMEWSDWGSDHLFHLDNQQFSYPFDVLFLSCDVRSLAPPYFVHKNIWQAQQQSTYTIRSGDTFTLSDYRVTVTTTNK